MSQAQGDHPYEGGRGARTAPEAGRVPSRDDLPRGGLPDDRPADAAMPDDRPRGDTGLVPGTRRVRDTGNGMALAGFFGLCALVALVALLFFVF